MKNHKFQGKQGSVVVPLLVGLTVVALVFGIFILGGSRDEQGRFVFPFQKDQLSGQSGPWWMPPDEPEVAVTPLPTQKIILSQFLLEISSPVDGAVVSQNQVVVAGKTRAGAEVSVNEKDLVADANGNFSITVSLEEGENYLYITAGNEDGFEEKELRVSYER